MVFVVFIFSRWRGMGFWGLYLKVRGKFDVVIVFVVTFE